MTDSELKSQYKQETGNDTTEIQFGGSRQKGRWILETTDEEMFKALGRNFNVAIPDPEYINWLKEKAKENYINKSKAL